MVLCFVQNFFFRLHKSYNIYILCRAKCEIFFPEINIRLYDKNSESDYFFFSSTKIRIFFSATLGIRIFFQKKTITPPPSFKLNGRSLNCIIFSDYDSLRDVRKRTTEWLILIKKNMKLTACMYIRVMISYARNYSLCGFRKINTNLLYTLTILIICKENKN